MSHSKTDKICVEFLIGFSSHILHRIFVEVPAMVSVRVNGFWVGLKYGRV